MNIYCDFRSVKLRLDAKKFATRFSRTTRTTV